MGRDLLDTDEVAELLGYTTQHIRRLARQRRIPAVKIAGGEWRFWQNVLREWIAQGCPSLEEQPSLFPGGFGA